ncbi:MAG: iron-containing alcohol dehydrogenase, partial [Bacteroidota bacterium]
GAVEPGPEKVPFIAVPTTSGTGSEATKNAVISETGTNGFKKSLRHNNYVPDVALIDPQLILECPPDVTAASGMDALCQLLESFVSLNATEFTDILAFDGLKRVRKSLLITYLSGNDLDARSNMAYGAYISGITLANAGLGTVHGLASPLGGYHNIPHGVVCGTLLAETTAKTVQHLISDQPSHPSLKKYARVGRLFSGKENLSIPAYAEILVESLYELTYKLQIPGLGDYGIKEDDFDRIATSASNKNNPVKLEKSEIIEILKSRL